MQARKDNQKLGQVGLTDFHKVKANNTSKSMSLLSGFTVVVIALDIWTILDLSYNCVSQSQK